MPTAKKKPIKKKKKFSPLLIIFIVLVLIFLLSMAISYYLTDGNSSFFGNKSTVSDSEINLVQNENSPQKQVMTPLEGIWVSYYDGAILTISGQSFTLELPSVDSPEKISGEIAVESTIATFYYKNGTKSCLDTEGHYQFSFENEELNFKIIKDLCASRSERMISNWFKL